VRGTEARSWLHGLLTCNVEGVTVERGAWGLLLNKRGKIVCDLTIIADADGLWLGSASDIRILHELLDEYLVMEDAEIELASATTWFTLHGVGALAAARGVPSLAAGELGWNRGEGAALLVADTNADATREQLVRDFGVRLLDDAAWSLLRVRSGLPEFGVDFGPDDNPHEAGLDRRTVDWSKGCYLGQEVVCMQDMRGKVKRRLARLRFDFGGEGLGVGGRPAAAGQPITDSGGAEVGRVTTAAGEFVAGEVAAIARLKAPFFEPGSTVLLEQQPATVLELLPESP
jgi:folate-binding protein YgfZ